MTDKIEYPIETPAAPESIEVAAAPEAVEAPAAPESNPTVHDLLLDLIRAHHEIGQKIAALRTMIGPSI